MTTTYETRVTALTVLPEGQEVYSEMATTIRIDDESGGEFVLVEQSGRDDLSKIAINPDEWPALRDAITRMVDACRPAGKP